MVSVHDIAAYILQRHGPISAAKLQKLVYYAQAWSLVWDDRPLFPEKIEAWANGPIVLELYERHKSLFSVDCWPYGDPGALDANARETVDAILDYYGPHNVQWLSDLIHAEEPWRLAREGLRDGERGEREIALEAMMDYYSNLPIEAALVA